MISRLPTSSAVLDELLCRMWESSFTYLSIMICSTYNTVMMAIERYIKVVHPLRYKSLNVKKLVKRLIVATWLLGLIAFIVFVFNVYVEDAICCAVDVGEHLNVAMAFFDLGYLYLLPLLILIFCYSSIAYSLLVISRRQGPVKVSKPNPTQPTWTSTLPVPSIAMCRAESDHRQARVTTAFRGTLRTMILPSATIVGPANDGYFGIIRNVLNCHWKRYGELGRLIKTYYLRDKFRAKVIIKILKIPAESSTSANRWRQ